MKGIEIWKRYWCAPRRFQNFEDQMSLCLHCGHKSRKRKKIKRTLTKCAPSASNISIASQVVKRFVAKVKHDGEMEGA